VDVVEALVDEGRKEMTCVSREHEATTASAVAQTPP
jgi:hypothetical protein